MPIVWLIKVLIAIALDA